jgi:hypothetical protein
MSAGGLQCSRTLLYRCNVNIIRDPAEISLIVISAYYDGSRERTSDYERDRRGIDVTRDREKGTHSR